MSMAISSLKRYGANISTHTKNWRPQILLLNKLDAENAEVKYPQLLSKLKINPCLGFSLRFGPIIEFPLKISTFTVLEPKNYLIQ